MKKELTHVDEQGHVQMVDVTAKPDTDRRSLAEAWVQMQPTTLEMIVAGSHAKGDVLATARLAGIQAAKRTWELIPLCHPLMLTGVKVTLEVSGADRLHVLAECRVKGPTGVEMEALTAASIAALTVYDMCKAVDKGITITDVRLVEKSGGRSGHFQRSAEEPNE